MQICLHNHLSDRKHRNDAVSDDWTLDTHVSLECLMERYQQADGEAAEKLIGVLAPVLYRFLAGQLGDRLGAEDMLQDVFLKIHQARHSYRANHPVLPWAFAIARHVRVSDYRRRCRTSMREIAIEDMPQPIPNLPFQRHALSELKTLMAGLPDSQCEVLVMLKVNDLSLKEVAQVTSSTVGAVKQKSHRAYQKLRVLLAK